MYIVVHSFTEMVPILLTKTGAKFVCSEKFNQDRLEIFFGQQRARGRRSTNPPVQHFLYNTQAIRASKSLIQGSCKNIERKKQTVSREQFKSLCSPLRKRRKTEPKKLSY